MPKMISEQPEIPREVTKKEKKRLLLWSCGPVVNNPPDNCRGQGCNPRSGKIPHAKPLYHNNSDQALEPMLCNKRSPLLHN